jgi:AcrR family transcriptional regulator
VARKPAGDGPANAAERREVILKTAAALFASQGTNATTVRQIADAAGILSGSLYYYFPSKEDIIDAVLSQSLTDLLEWSRQAGDETDSPTERLRSLVRAAFRVVQEHPEASSIYLNDRTVLLGTPRFRYLEDVRVDYAGLWLDVIADGVARGEFRADVDPLVFFRLASYPIWLTIGQLDSGVSTDEIADQHLALLLDGFRAG